MKIFFAIYFICFLIIPFSVFAKDPVSSFVDGFNEGYTNAREEQERQSEIEKNQAQKDKDEVDTLLKLEELKKINPDAYNNYIVNKQRQYKAAEQANEARVALLVVLLISIIGLSIWGLSIGSTGGSY